MKLDFHLPQWSIVVYDIGSSHFDCVLLCDTLVLLVDDTNWTVTSLRQRQRRMQKLRQTHSPCLSSLTEKYEKRAIFTFVLTAKVFPLFVKALYPRKCPTPFAGGRTRVRAIVVHRSEWTDRGSDVVEKWKTAVWAASTWEKLQSRILKYIARINVARYYPDTSQRYFSIARGYLLRWTALPWLSSSLRC